MNRVFYLLLAIAFLPSLSSGAEPEHFSVFDAAKDGFASIRIPAIAVTSKGTLIAIAEGREKDADQAKNRLVMKRSTDGGKTWSRIEVIARDGEKSLNNPCLVVDSPSGALLLIYQSYPEGIGELSNKIETGTTGNRIVRNHLIRSENDGLSWSSPVDITRETKRETRVTTLASGPGIGIQLKKGKYAGRLLVPFNEGPFGLWNIYVAYSDDHGKTWKLGDVVPDGFVDDPKKGKISTVNEAQVVELEDGSVRFNVRRWAGNKVRKTSVSKDGGVTWSSAGDVPEQADPSCMASIYRLAFPSNQARSLILFSGPQSNKRENGTIFASFDEGKSWPVKRVLVPGPFAYSCLTSLPDGTVGCLYELNDAKRIMFARFSPDWLTNTKEK